MTPTKTKAAIGARVMYCGHAGYFIADIFHFNGVCAIKANGPITPANIVREGLENATHHVEDAPFRGFWCPERGVLVVPEDQLTLLAEDKSAPEPPVRKPLKDFYTYRYLLRFHVKKDATFESPFGKALSKLADSFGFGIMWEFGGERSISVHVERKTSLEDRQKLRQRLDQFMERWQKKGVILLTEPRKKT